MKHLLLLISIFCITSQLFSQLRTVNGHVSLENATSHEGATVNLIRLAPSSLTYTLSTDSDGNYDVGVEEGIYKLIFSKTGFINDTIYDFMVYADATAQDVVLESLGLSGPLSGTIDPGTYKIGGHISVEAGSSLTISPGVIFEFNEDISFTINGQIIANGTETDSIVFTNYETNKKWKGIELNELDNNSQISYCKIEFANDAGLRIFDSELEISHCEIYKCSRVQCGMYNSGGGGMHLYNSSMTLKNLLVHHNSTVGGGYGAGITFMDDNSTIVNSIVSDNYGAEEGGGIFLVYSPNGTAITNCLICNNSANKGGGIAGPSKSYISNSIIANNNSNSWGGISGGYNSTFVSFSNVWNNTPQNFYNCNAYVGDIITTNAHGTDCDAFFNIVENPMFYDANNGDYSLNSNSPCIDAGTNDSIQQTLDYNNNDRFFDGNNDNTATVDMGPIEFDPSLIPNAASFLEETQLKLYPNPAQDYVIIDASGSETYMLNIVDVYGKNVYSKNFYEKVVIPTNGFSKGVYFIQMASGNKTAVKKLLIE